MTLFESEAGDSKQFEKQAARSRVFRPSISTNAHVLAVNRENRASGPLFVLGSNEMNIFDPCDGSYNDENPYVYLLHE